MPFDEIKEVHVISLAGLGASYRMIGYFSLETMEGKIVKINFKGLAFGGHYGGHNVNVQISPKAKKNIIAARSCSALEVDSILAEVQRRMLNGEMIVEYDKIKPENPEPLGNLGI
ncbi:MAG: hypothetical protein ACYC7D_02965 [Nitrososphaerales archaeon]